MEFEGADLNYRNANAVCAVNGGQTGGSLADVGADEVSCEVPAEGRLLV